MKRLPNSILKSPTEHGDDTIPIPSAGLMNVRRRVSFGPQQIHEFSVETTYSQGTNDSNLAATYSSDSVQQQTGLTYMPTSGKLDRDIKLAGHLGIWLDRITKNTQHSTMSLGESMELTCMGTFSEEDHISFQNQNQSSDLQPIPAPRVQCGRDLPVVQPTRVPLLEKPSHRNNRLPCEHIQDLLVQNNEFYDSVPSDPRNAHLFVQEEKVCQNDIPLPIEFTFMNQQNSSLAVAPDSKQPVHFHTQDSLHNTSRMSWLNYSQNNFTDKVDESAQTTLNYSPITSPILGCKSPFDITLYLPSTEHVDKLKYERYLDYKRKISILRPQVAKLLQEVEVMSTTKDNLESKYRDEVTQVRILRKKLADTKSAIRDRRAAIQVEVTPRLQSIKNDLLSNQQ